MENEELNLNDVIIEAIDEPQKEKVSFRKEFFEWLEIVITAIVAVVLIFTFFVRIATIDGKSMENTLHHGEKVLISNIGYTPKQGDIVVLSRNYNNVNPADISWPQNTYNTDPIIKRIIATEGQIVDIDFEKGIVYVDGKPLNEKYVKTPTNNRGDVQFPAKVPKGCVFVLGDNRNDSSDSRFSALGGNDDGMISEDYIIGKVFFRILPFNKIGGVD